MRRLWLIAQREIAAYASTPSFWIALLMGPLLVLATAIAGAAPHGGSPPPPPAQAVAVASNDAVLREAVTEALVEANRFGAPGVKILPQGQSGPADTVLAMTGTAAGGVEVAVTGDPIDPIATALMQRDLRAILRQRALQQAGAPQDVLAAAAAVQVQILPPLRPAVSIAPPAPDVGRFALVFLLWINLVGTLGMLLNAIVRERSNHALEGLLAAARATEIIFGKLLGVGLLSLLVMATWLGAGAMVSLTPLGAAGQGLEQQLLGAFRNPLALAQALGIYVVAFAMYGSAVIGLGALARDVPSAQNLSRPVFGVLLLVFFGALSQLTGTSGLASWMIWVPPLTPFVMLTSPAGAQSAVEVLGACLLMLVTTAMVATAATLALRGAPIRLFPGKTAAAA